MFVLNITKFII